MASLVEDFLNRRLQKLQKDISQFLNVNPFLMSALKHFHSFNSLHDLAEFLFVAHMSAGHATGFGKLVDEKVLPEVFGTVKLTETERKKRNFTAAAFNEVDHIVNPESSKDWSLLSLKAGAWTIQDTAAHNIYNAFKQLGDFKLYGKEIVVGVFYGNESLLTNKYSILRGINPRQQSQFVKLEHVRVLAGKEFWTWLNGGQEDTQEWVLEGTHVGADRAFNKGGSKNRDLVQNAPKQLSEELAKKYGLSLKGEIDWSQLLIAINDPPDA